MFWFWQNPKNLQGIERILYFFLFPFWWGLLLIPTFIWQAGRITRKYYQLWRYQKHPNKLPILLVGNIIVGGGGKTPTAIMLRHYFPQSVVLVKNYKTTWQFNEDAILIEKNQIRKWHGKKIMDEALLHARYGDVVLCQNRYDGLTLIHKLQKNKKYKIIICDDGFEDYTFKSDMVLLCFLNDTKFYNGMTMPMGSLRQSWRSAKNNRHRPPDAILHITEDSKKIFSNNKIKTFTLTKQYHPPFAHHKKLFAFAGIAEPKKFFETLGKLGGHIVAKEKFPDHHNFQDKDILTLESLARKYQSRLITTEKNWVKLSDEQKKRILYLPMKLKANPLLIDFIKERLYNK